MNSLNGLSYTSTNLSGLATGIFDEIVPQDATYPLIVLGNQISRG